MQATLTAVPANIKAVISDTLADAQEALRVLKGVDVSRREIREFAENWTSSLIAIHETERPVEFWPPITAEQIEAYRDMLLTSIVWTMH